MPSPDDAEPDDAEPIDGAAAPLPPAPELEALVSTAEQQLLGGPRTYTRGQVAERTEVPLPDLQRLWRGLGFPSVADDDVVFTDADVNALENVRALQRIAAVDDELMTAMVRILGQSMARLASWQSELVVEMVERHPDVLTGGSPDLRQLMDLLIPTVERIQNYVWRRQLAAVFGRMAANAGLGSSEARPTTVGFVDMSGFTSFTRAASEVELRRVLTAFEELATDVVASHEGEIVKTIGDEILFVCRDPGRAADAALSLVERAREDDVLPPVRGGLAYGPVVNRLGDVYGQTVNIASRLTSLARRDSVLVDKGLSEALADDTRFILRSMRPTSVRGYHHLFAWRLRRRET